MRVTLKDGTPVEIDNQPVTSGAEAQIFASTDGNWMIKKYLRVDRRAEREKTLDYCERHNPYRENPTYWGTRLAWPQSRIEKPWFGMIMPRIRGEMKSMAHFVGKRSYPLLRASHPHMIGDWGDRVHITTELARITHEAFASRGLCHADFSPNNVLINEREQRVALVDCDGIVIPGFTSSEVSGTSGYAAPEVWSGKQTADVLADRYSLAVLLYQFLLFRHPMDGRRPDLAPDAIESERLKYGARALYSEDRRDKANAVDDSQGRGKVFRSDVLGKEIADLFHSVFSDMLHKNREQRPRVDQWRGALERMSAALVPCSNPQCRYKHFSVFGALRVHPATLRCPWCETPFRTAARLPVLHLYEDGQGYFPASRYDYAVGLDQRALGIWQIDPARQLGANFPDADRRPVVTFKAARDRMAEQWTLRNHSLPNLLQISADGVLTEAMPGNALELKDRSTVVFQYPGADGKIHDRLARVYLIGTQNPKMG